VDGVRSIIVIGAGVFGLTAALELRTRGWRVTVVDPGPVPRAAAASTDISKVVRMDYGADELYTAMAEASLEGWHRWNAMWESPLYHQDGFLLLTTDVMQPGGFEHDSFALLRLRGHAPQRLRPGDLDRRFAAWSSARYRDGYFNPRAGWVESGKVLARLAAEAAARGVLIAEGIAFEHLLESDAGVAGVRTASGRNLHAEAVLVAAGAWTPTLLPHLGRVMWSIGQPVVHLKVNRATEWQAPEFPVWAADISRTGWYGFPALADGTLKIGHHGPGRPVHPDDARTVLASELAPFRAFVQESLPALSEAPIIATRICLYCDTFDGDFWIDHDPARAGLVVAAGDSGHGFKFAPVLGGLIADVVERRPNSWSSRFAWRARETDRKEAARAKLEITQRTE
jgi:glycine/D-amino acid oxidase-like deaminating enzyme